MTQEELQKSQSVVASVQNTMFFGKLAEYGIKPETKEQAEEIMKYAQQLLQYYPRQSPDVKTACFNESGIDRKAYDAEVNKITDELCGNAEFVKSAQLVLAAQNL